MHGLFVHKNFPDQFGHIAAYLVKQKGYRLKQDDFDLRRLLFLGQLKPADQVVKDPAAYRHLGQAGEQPIREHYSLHTLIPRLMAFYEDVAATA
jgi:hypothetical protein